MSGIVHPSSWARSRSRWENYLDAEVERALFCTLDMTYQELVPELACSGRAGEIGLRLRGQVARGPKEKGCPVRAVPQELFHGRRQARQRTLRVVR